MPTLGVSADTFERDVIGSVMAIVTFMTASSEAFTALSDDLEAFADANPDITFATIDAEVESGLAAAARIDAIPTIMAFREGNLVFRERGALENETIQQLIDTLRGLDMQEVRRTLAERAHTRTEPTRAAEVSVQELAEALQRSALVLDVRTPLEYSSGHVPGAVLMPLHTLARGAENLPKDARIYLICKVGDRSRQGCELLSGLGYAAINVAGGMEAWKAAGLTCETGS